MRWSRCTGVLHCCLLCRRQCQFTPLVTGVGELGAPALLQTQVCEPR
jgi:hypothetical protein